MKKIILIALALLATNTMALGISKVTASSWLVADSSGNVIRGENTNQVRSIASISKLMTVMIVLDAGQALDARIGKYTRQQLIDLALVKSSNAAAQALCDNYPGGRTSCIAVMNTKSALIGMNSTEFYDPTGLNPRNTSTAEDLIQLVLNASLYEPIRAAARMSSVKIKVKKHRWAVFNNTNPMIGRGHDFVVSKTGYIHQSGGCIVMMMNTEIGKRIVVLLGSKNVRTRIPEAEFIAGVDFDTDKN